MNNLQDHIALVTGSSRGIGAAIATLLAEQGARVVVHGRDSAALDTVRGRIESAGGTALSVLGDLTRFADVEAIRAHVEEHLGPVDLLVANAGGSPLRPGPLEEISDLDWHASLDANLTATFLTVKSFLPGMKQRRRGTIITMSSAAARRSNAASPVAYAVAKAGIEQLTKNLAAQAGPFGIRVNCIAPETIMTERNQREIPEDIQAKSWRLIPSGASARQRMSRTLRCSSPRTTPRGSAASSSMSPADPCSSESVCVVGRQRAARPSSSAACMFRCT